MRDNALKQRPDELKRNHEDNVNDSSEKLRVEIGVEDEDRCRRR